LYSSLLGLPVLLKKRSLEKKKFSKEIVYTTKYKMRRTGMVEKDEQILDTLDELAKETMAVLKKKGVSLKVDDFLKERKR